MTDNKQKNDLIKPDHHNDENLMVRSEINKAIADRLKVIIGDQSASSFARKAGIHATSLSKNVRGEAAPNSSTLYDIYKYSGVSIHWILTGEGPMMANDFINLNKDNEYKKSDNFDRWQFTECLMAVDMRLNKLSKIMNMEFDLDKKISIAYVIYDLVMKQKRENNPANINEIMQSIMNG